MRNNFGRVVVGVVLVLTFMTLCSLVVAADDSIVTLKPRLDEVGFVQRKQPGRHFWGWPSVYAGPYGDGNDFITLIGIHLPVLPTCEVKEVTLTLGGVLTKWVGDTAVFRVELLSSDFSYLWQQYGYWDFHMVRPIGIIGEVKGDELEDGGSIELKFPEHLLPYVQEALAHAQTNRSWLLPIRIRGKDGLLELTSGAWGVPYNLVELRIKYEPVIVLPPDPPA